ncbi:unnamed protein product [Mucor hiemalis]
MESSKKALTKHASANEITSLLNGVQQETYGGRDDDVQRSEESLETGKYNRNNTARDKGFLKKYGKTPLLLSLISLTLLFIVYVLVKPFTVVSNFDFNEINTIISFGDSYTTRFLDMNTLTYACRNCTSAGGPNWVVYLSETNDWVSWDFAYNSAPVNNTLVHQSPSVIDISTQVHELFPKVFVSPTDEISAIVASKYMNNQTRSQKSTLTTIWVGINDIDITYDWENVDDIDSSIMYQYQALINKLINQGLNQFMLINVPPIDRAPMWRNTQSEDIIKVRVQGYNRKLKNMIERLKYAYSSATFIEYDAWSYFNKVMDNYKDYDLTDIEFFCPDWSNPVERKCRPIGE